MITKIDEFRKYLSERAAGSKLPEYTIKCKDPDCELKPIIEYIKKIGDGGHSFTILLQCDEVGEDRKFYWDGDGGDYIDAIEQTVGGYTITCRDLEGELFGLLNGLAEMSSQYKVTIDPKEDDEMEFTSKGKLKIERVISDSEKVDEKLSKEAQAFISDKIKILIEEGRPAAQAKAIAYSMAEKEGFKIPKRKKKKASK